MRGRAALVAVLVLALVGCTQGGRRAPSPSSATTTAAPASSRPVVSLSYEVADDLRSVRGSESIRFTPDLEVCEVVLRAWPNKPVLTRAGNKMTVGQVSVDGVALSARVQAAGALAGAPGTLVEVTLPDCRPAGSVLNIRAEFAVTLGADTDERMGYATTGSLAWFQTAYPLLAWQAGVGWVRDSAVDLYGETATSESFMLTDLAVTAPSHYSVAGLGVKGAAVAQGARTTHHFAAEATRDVSVMVGAVTVAEHQVASTTVHLAVPAFARLNDAAAWRAQVTASLTNLEAYLGPLPMRDLWVTVVPGASEGIESSGSVQLGGAARRIEAWLVTHELAHQWTYALVGNNQALHPWMDESVTSMIQAVVDDENLSADTSDDTSDDALENAGRPMSFFASLRRPGEAYNDAVYGAGADILIEARDEAGHEAFDAALRGYIRANAYRVATPEDFAASFAHMPSVTQLLREHDMAG